MKKGIFDEYFSFTASEKRATILISILILAGIATSLTIKYFPKEKSHYTEEQLKEIDGIVATLSENSNEESFREPKKTVRQFFLFDPNTASKIEFKKLGLSERQINTINNYINSGGKFYKKQDFKKIYTITEDEYLLLEPYIRIKSSPEAKNEKIETSVSEPLYSEKESFESKSYTIELNSAEHYNLTLLKGIGEVYANRILKYRDLLGGFYKKEQLLEVYGINDSIFQQIVSQIEIDTTRITAISLNKASYKDLIKHPYLDSYLTKAILDYKKFRKEEISKEDLLRDNVVPKETYEKLFSYLKP